MLSLRKATGLNTSIVQYSKGGPIIAVQVENEYGAYATDQEYMPFIKEVGGTFISSKKPFSLCLIAVSHQSFLRKPVQHLRPVGAAVAGRHRAAAHL